MQSVGLLEPRPPYIQFERRAIERRKVEAEGGGVFYVELDFAIVTPAGSKDCIEKVVEEWFPYLREQTRQGRFPQQWLDAYKSSYEAWKSDQEPPINGTSIKACPVFSVGEVKNLLALHVVAVEDLAQANEELLGRLGMGGRSLKQKAIDYLQAKGDHGPLVEKLDAMAQTLAGLEQRLLASEALNKKLSAQLELRQAPAPEVRYVQQEAPQTGPTDDALVDDAIESELR